MADRKTAHRNALLLALALTGLVLGLGIPVAGGAPDIDQYVVNVIDAWTGWPFGWMKLSTTSYSSGSYLGAVMAAQTHAESWPLLTISEDGTSVASIDSHRKLAIAHFTCTTWVVWPAIPLETKSAALHKQVSFYGSNFDYLCWWT